MSSSSRSNSGIMVIEGLEIEMSDHDKVLHEKV